MKNEDITKYDKMIYKITNKYRSKYLDAEDLYQIGAIGIIYAYESYKPDSNMAFDTWVYNCIKWRVLRALRPDKKAQDVTEISIYEEVPGGENIQLIDMLEDTSINVYHTIENRLMKQFFIDEFERILEGQELEYIKYMYTHNIYSYKKLEEVFGVGYNEVRRTIEKGYRKLGYKSVYLRKRYNEIRATRKLVKTNEYKYDPLDIIIRMS